jgi:predicted nucleic-acid-binding protein
MIGLDTNVLVRFLVEDEPAQARLALQLIEREIAACKRLFVSQIVLCELVWVLASAYEFRRTEIVGVLADLLRSRDLEIEDRDAAVRALDAYAKTKGDLSDFLILERAKAAGCRTVATFDKALLERPGFVRP